jgi:hypothetical protein
MPSRVYTMMGVRVRRACSMTNAVTSWNALLRSDAAATTTIRSIFGTHRFEQFTYAPGPKKAIALRPISARMELPARQWSYLLQEFTQMLAVDSAYEQATANLGTAD